MFFTESCVLGMRGVVFLSLSPKTRPWVLPEREGCARSVYSWIRTSDAN